MPELPKFQGHQELTKEIMNEIRRILLRGTIMTAAPPLEVSNPGGIKTIRLSSSFLSQLQGASTPKEHDIGVVGFPARIIFMKYPSWTQKRAYQWDRLDFAPHGRYTNASAKDNVPRFGGLWVNFRFVIGPDDKFYQELVDEGMEGTYIEDPAYEINDQLVADSGQLPYVVPDGSVVWMYRGSYNSVTNTWEWLFNHCCKKPPAIPRDSFKFFDLASCVPDEIPSSATIKIVAQCGCIATEGIEVTLDETEPGSGLYIGVSSTGESCLIDWAVDARPWLGIPIDQNDPYSVSTSNSKVINIFASHFLFTAVGWPFCQLPIGGGIGNKASFMMFGLTNEFDEDPSHDCCFSTDLYGFGLENERFINGELYFTL